MTPKPTKPKGRYDRLDGNGRRWIIITYERRLRVWRFIEAEKQAAPNAPQMTLNMALSQLLATAIDALPEE